MKVIYLIYSHIICRDTFPDNINVWMVLRMHEHKDIPLANLINCNRITVNCN